jgi:membrane protein required for colicin V production
LGKAIKASLDDSFLGKVDQAAGAVLGLVKIVFMVSVLIWILDSLKVSSHATWAETSWLYPKIAVFAPQVTHWISQFIPFFKNIF